MAIQIMFIDELHSIYKLFAMSRKHQLQLYSKRSLVVVYKAFNCSFIVKCLNLSLPFAEFNTHIIYSCAALDVFQQGCPKCHSTGQNDTIF